MKNLDESPDIFKSKPITTNLKEDNDIFVKALIDHFIALNSEFKMKPNLDKYSVTSKHSSFGSEDIEQISIPFQIIEEIVFKDADSFLYIYKWYNLFNRPIFDSEWTDSDNLLDTFCKSSDCIMFVRADDTIFDVNDAFCAEFEIDEEEL